MKKAMTFLGAILVASTILTSCGGGKNGIEVNPKSTVVKGELSEYFHVVEGSYKLVQGDKYTDNSNDPPKEAYYYILKVQVERTSKEFNFNAVDLQSRGYLSVVCDLFDAEGTPVITADREGTKTQGVNSEDKAMVSLKPGESGWSIFQFIGKDEEMKTVKTFEVCSNVNMNKVESVSSGSSSTAEPAEGVPSGGIDCDQFIKDYSAFADSYIKLLNKRRASPKDPSILIEYTDAAAKALVMQKNASSCNDAEHSAKILEIANRIAKAAL